jgi:hypothetical protein
MLIEVISEHVLEDRMPNSPSNIKFTLERYFLYFGRKSALSNNIFWSEI